MTDDLIHITKEAARILRCSESYLNKLRCTGGGPEFIKIGASIGYRRSALDRWTQERSFKSTTEADAQLGRRNRAVDLSLEAGQPTSGTGTSNDARGSST